MATKLFFSGRFVGRSPKQGSKFFGVSDAVNIQAVVCAANEAAANKRLEDLEIYLCDEFELVSCANKASRMTKRQVKNPPIPLDQRHIRAAMGGAAAYGLFAATDKPGKFADIRPLSPDEAELMRSDGSLVVMEI